VRKHQARLLIVVVCVLGLLLIAWPALARTAAPERAQLADVWQRVRESGAYSFRAQVIQESIPRATVQNIGRTC